MNHDWLPFDACGESDLERAFNSFHAQNPHIYDAIEKWAKKMHREGRTRISVKGFLDELRNKYETTGGRYRVDNNHSSFYARMLLKHHPEMRRAIVTRKPPHSQQPARSVSVGALVQ